MKYDSATPYIAAFVIFRKQGKIAFVLRSNTQWMNGHYGLPAGKVEKDESFLQAAVREAKEEVGADLEQRNLMHALTVYRKSGEEDMSWIDIIFEAKGWEGELYNAEPDKHSAVEWLDPENLPDNVIPVCKFYFDQIKAGNHYAEYGW